MASPHQGSVHDVLPHALKRIRLILARSKAFPEGSARHGYEFVAPLDPDGQHDPCFGTSIGSDAACGGSGAAKARSAI